MLVMCDLNLPTVTVRRCRKAIYGFRIAPAGGASSTAARPCSRGRGLPAFETFLPLFCSGGTDSPHYSLTLPPSSTTSRYVVATITAFSLYVYLPTYRGCNERDQQLNSDSHIRTPDFLVHTMRAVRTPEDAALHGDAVCNRQQPSSLP